MITRLQAEGIQVLEAKQDMLDIKEVSQGALSDGPSEQQLREHLDKNEAQLKRVIHLLKGADQSAEFVSTDKLPHLLELGKGELAHAFDILITELDNREKVIEQRIAKQLDHIGIDERILFDHKNFTVELEDLQSYKNFADRQILPEEIIAINHQIQYVIQHKNMSAEEKFARLI
jgi:ASC-1-like (ASCH) protein